MLKIPRIKIERYLYRKGFHVPEVRTLASQQVVLLIYSILALSFGRLGADYFSGVVLGTANFLALARIIQELVYLRRGRYLFSF